MESSCIFHYSKINFLKSWCILHAAGSRSGINFLFIICIHNSLPFHPANSYKVNFSGNSICDMLCARINVASRNVASSPLRLHNERLSDINLRVTRYAFQRAAQPASSNEILTGITWGKFYVYTACMCYYAALNLRTMQRESLPEQRRMYYVRYGRSVYDVWSSAVLYVLANVQRSFLGSSFAQRK